MYEALANMLNALFELGRTQMEGLARMTAISFDNATGQGDYAGIWSKATTTATNVLVPIAISIVVIFFLISIAEKVMSESFTLEIFIKEILKLCAGLFLVTNSIPIVVGLIELGNGILNKVVLGNFEIAAQYEVFKPNEIKELGAIPGVVACLMMEVGLFGQLIIGLLMKVVCIIRILEIALRTATSPLALSDTFSGNLLNSHAINFIRSFGALCLQGIFIALICTFIPTFWTNAFITNPPTGLFGWLGNMVEFITVQVACLILMFKANSISREMLGAR